MALLLAAQAVAILVLANSVSRPVTTSYLVIDELASRSANAVVYAQGTKPIFDLNIAYLVATFLLVSAVAYITVATVYRKRYEAEIAQGVNRARWLERSVTVSLMLVTIALLIGLYDLSSLIMIISLTCIVNMAGLALELMAQNNNQARKFVNYVGMKAALIPWLVFIIYAWGSKVYGNGLPSFVYWIYLSIFALFGVVALVRNKHDKSKGKWADYLYTERAYIILGLVASSALAWQVFAGILR